MRSCVRVWIAVCLASVFAVLAAQAKPRIAILATGGTIAGAQADTTQAGYQAGKFKIGGRGQ